MSQTLNVHVEIDIQRNILALMRKQLRSIRYFFIEMLQKLKLNFRKQCTSFYL